MRQSKILLTALTSALLVLTAGAPSSALAQAAPLPISQLPLYLSQALPPLNMLVMGKDHKNYYEAYNDAADLNGDGAIDVGYKPDVIDYYGYFNSNVCYIWNATSNRFDPTTVAGGTKNKQCSGAADWSGDFLNYLTTGRFDALRKVLYGGWRQVDGASDTVLQGAFFPQDGHSWGKEYKGIDRDGYDIALYSPLSQPLDSTYHLFAVTTLSDNSAPLLRVLNDSPYRIWNWVSIEGPVAGNGCFNSANQRVTCVSGGTASAFPGHPNDRAGFNTMETVYAVAANQFGTVYPSTTINCSSNDCNKGSTQEDNFLSIATARFRLQDDDRANGDYEFCVDGDDAIDVEILADNGNVIGSAGWYGGHGFANNCNAPRATASITLAKDQTYVIKFRHEEATGGEGYRLQWRKTSGTTTFAWKDFARDNDGGPGVKRTNTGGNQTDFSFRFYNLTPSTTASARTDYAIRVLACPSTPALRETNCKQYGTGAGAVFKPTGILHDFGETNRMYFGLLTGSQGNNLNGGVLRRNLSSFADEINPATGQFLTTVNGIVRTLDRFRMIGGGYQGNGNWAWNNGTGNCPSVGDRAIANGECRMWGNPIGEMMFETLRYYAGAGAATASYATGGATEGTTEETTLGLTAPAWKDPYAPVASDGLGYRSCAKPVVTVISDVNPSYDSDVPGNGWSSPTFVLPTEINSFSLATQGAAMWENEFGTGSKSVFIGQTGTTASDGAPTLKSASSFGTIRGLAPEEPTKQGSFSSSTVANYGWTKTGRINALSTEKVRTYAVALASPLPTIQFPVNGRNVNFVPFAKTAGGTFGGGTQKPTNTIVDFYIEEYVNLPGQDVDASINGGRPYAVFRINYEDVEQGNDHDMDAIVRYEFKADLAGTVTVTLNSEYAAGSAIQHMGYIANGTTTDGVYLEVRDFDTCANANAPTGVAWASATGCSDTSPAYLFNTPPGSPAGQCATGLGIAPCNRGLPLTATRVFTPGGSSTVVTPLRDPLWYAAKYGGFSDRNNNQKPDLQVEWDSNSDGRPDNYFLVTNALTLKDELTKAFSQIERDSRPSGGIAASGTRRDSDFLAYVPEYNAQDWTGDVKAYSLNTNGTLGTLRWSAEANLPVPADRKLFAMVKNGATILPQDFSVAGLGGATNAPAALGLTTLGITAKYGATTTIADIVAFLRGTRTKEVDINAGTGVFRTRSRPLGDILGSQPEVLSRGAQAYFELPAAQGGGATGAGSYGDFVTNTKLTRTPVLFVGANDGFLHAFDARATGDGGKELFAIAPSTTLNKMGALADPAYLHSYYVDAPPSQGDARLGTQWKTIVLNTAGAGGKSAMIIDATNPAASFTTSNILYEVVDDALGNSFGRGKVILANDNRWYAVFANGLNSALHQSALIMVDLQTGAVRRLMTGLGTQADPNGMGGVVDVDRNFDTKVDILYGADYQGRVWKFDLTSSNPASWGVALGGTPLFVATNAAGQRQNITGSLDVVNHFEQGYIVYFGTGRYVLTGDGIVPVNAPVESFYAVWDNQSSTAGTRTSLTAQTVLNEVAGSRATSSNAVNWSTMRGWYLDLQVTSPTPAPLGERFVGEPVVRVGRVLFTTFTPVGDECSPGGVNWLYSLNAFTGAPQLSSLPNGTASGAVSLTPPGQSAPPAVAPPIVVTPQPPQDPPADTDPSGEDDPEPPCVGPDCPPPCTGPDCPTPPGTPPASIRGRECRNSVGALTSTGIIEFSSIQCGRLSWRQIN